MHMGEGKTKQTKKIKQKKSFYIGREQKKIKDWRYLDTLCNRELNERLIKDRIIRDIRALFELEEDYCKPKRVSNFWNNDYIGYESNGDKNRKLSLNQYLNKIELYLRNIMIDLQNSDTWKIQLTIAIILKDVEEECVMHSKFTPCSNVNEVIDEF